VFRSEKMELYRVTIPKDDAWKVVESLGNLDVAHFIDMNKGEQPFNLPYASRIKLCDETERRLAFLLTKCKEHHIKINKPASVQDFSHNIGSIEKEKRKAMHLLFDAIDQDVQDKEKFVSNQSKQISEMRAELNKLRDYETVLQFVQRMMPVIGNAAPARARNVDQETVEPLMQEGGISITFVAGTIKDGEQDRMKKLLFRVTRGKALTHFYPFEQDGQMKATYMVVYQDGQIIRERVLKICESFMGQRFEVPAMTDMADAVRKVKKDI